MLNRQAPPILAVLEGAEVAFLDAASSYRIQCIAANMTSDTIRGKEDSLAYFSEFLAEEGVVYLRDITPDVCTSYIGMRWQRGNSPATVRHHYVALKAAFRWICGRHGVANPWDSVTAPIVPFQAKPTVPGEVVAAFLALCDPKRAKGELDRLRRLRDTAMLQLLRCTPARIGDFETLRTEHVDLDHALVHVMTKGRKQDIRQWNKTECTESLASYIEARALVAKVDDLWIDARWRKTLGTGMERGWTRRMLARMGKVVGFHVNPHMFRHTFAANAVEAGMPLPLLETLGSWTKGSQALRVSYLSSINQQHGRQALIDYDPVPDLPVQPKPPGRPRQGSGE